MKPKLLYKKNGSSTPVSSYNRSGVYKIERTESEGQPWSLMVRYDAGESDKSCIVVFPGYRMRVAQGFIGNQISQKFNDAGFPVLAIDYGGFTDSKSPAYDQATMSTNIRDASCALSFLNVSSRIELSFSYGINISAQMDPHNRDAIVGVIPAPDIVHNKVVPIKPSMVSEQDNGQTILWYKRGSLALKCTEQFLKDSMQYSTLGGLSSCTQQSRIALIAGELDHLYSVDELRAWGETLRKNGLDVDLNVLEGVGHRFNSCLVDASFSSVQRVLSELSQVRRALQDVKPAQSCETLEAMTA